MKWNIAEEIVRQTQVLSAIDEANRILRQGSLLYQDSALDQAQRHLDELRRISDLTQAQTLLIENAKYELGSSASIMGKIPNSILDCVQGKLKALDIATQFRMPHLEEASRKLDELRATSNFRISTEFLATQREYQSLVSRLVTPWIDEKIPSLSYESVDRIASLAKSVLSPAYDPAAGKVLTSLLGEWSHDAFPEAAISDWRVRRDFYFGHGFDKLLSALPEPAFTNSLYEANILRPALFRYDYVEDETIEKNGEDKEALPEFRWKERGTEAYGILFSLETSLRIFIHNVMTERFGRGWEKKRVSQPVYESWNEKRQIAHKNGEAETRLIWFADFSDYIKIIERADNWREVFESLFHSKMDVQVSFSRLQPVRISTAHSRNVTKEDYLLLSVEAHRILKAIGMIDPGDE